MGIQKRITVSVIELLQLHYKLQLYLSAGNPADYQLSTNGKDINMIRKEKPSMYKYKCVCKCFSWEFRKD